MKKRDYALDFARGIGLVLIIIGHILRGLNDAEISITNFYLLDYIIYSIHLPLLFIISGITEKKFVKLKNKEKLKTYLKKTIISLYIPYIIFILIYWFLKMYVFSGNSNVSFGDLLTIWYSGKWIFWYLISLLLIKCIHSIFEYKDKKELGLLLFLIIYLINFFINSKIILWLSYGLFYAVGYNYELDDKININNKKISVFFILLLSFACTLFYTKYNNFIGMIVGGIPISFLLIEYSKVIVSDNIITNIGKYSMIIYLTHTIITSFTRTILLKVGITSIILNVLIGLLVSILSTFIITYSYKKIYFLRWIEFLFYPSRIRRDKI